MEDADPRSVASGLGAVIVRRLLLTIAVLIGVATPIIAAFAVFKGIEGLWPLSWLAWAPVGYVILLRRPGNGVGAASLFIGTTMGLSLFASALAAVQAAQEVRVWADMAGAIIGVLPWLGIVWLVLVYPTGRLQGLGERVTGAAVVTFALIGGGAFAFSSKPMFQTGAPSPLAIPALDPLTSLMVGPGFFVVIGLLLTAVILLLRRSRRSRGEERAQFRWLLFGALALLVALTAAQFFPEDGPGRFLFLPAGLAIPVTIGVAILRYRLYEIDRIISRTVSYVLVVGVLGLVVLASIALFAAFLPSDDPVVVAVSTLAAAALFNPVRRRVQALIDRRFNRSRYDAQRVVGSFTESLQEQVDPGHVVEGWVEVVEDTMQPSAVGYWVKEE